MAAAEEILLPSGALLLQGPTGKRWVEFDKNMGMTRADAIKACQGIDGKLGQVSEGPEFDYLAKVVKNSSWIDTFNGGNYGGQPISLYPGGAVAVPIGGEAAIEGLICELRADA